MCVIRVGIELIKWSLKGSTHFGQKVQVFQFWAEQGNCSLFSESLSALRRDIHDVFSQLHPKTEKIAGPTRVIVEASFADYNRLVSE